MIKMEIPPLFNLLPSKNKAVYFKIRIPVTSLLGFPIFSKMKNKNCQSISLGNNLF